ncbi:hypothetical protein PSPO01_16217 [Paraphaeosphaeria sporulosa]
MERLRAENRKFRDWTEELTLQETREGSEGSTDIDDPVEAFPDRKKHDKLSSTGKLLTSKDSRKWEELPTVTGGKICVVPWSKNTISRRDRKATLACFPIAMNIVHAANDGTIRASPQATTSSCPHRKGSCGVSCTSSPAPQRSLTWKR